MQDQSLELEEIVRNEISGCNTTRTTKNQRSRTNSLIEKNLEIADLEQHSSDNTAVRIRKAECRTVLVIVSGVFTLISSAGLITALFVLAKSAA